MPLISNSLGWRLRHWFNPFRTNHAKAGVRPLSSPSPCPSPCPFPPSPSPGTRQPMSASAQEPPASIPPASFVEVPLGQTFKTTTQRVRKRTHSSYATARESPLQNRISLATTSQDSPRSSSYMTAPLSPKPTQSSLTPTQETRTRLSIHFSENRETRPPKNTYRSCPSLRNAPEAPGWYHIVGDPGHDKRASSFPLSQKEELPHTPNGVAVEASAVRNLNAGTNFGMFVSQSWTDPDANC